MTRLTATKFGRGKVHGATASVVAATPTRSSANADGNSDVFQNVVFKLVMYATVERDNAMQVC